MAFAYYKKLNPLQRRIYQKSDQVSSLRLPSSDRWKPLVDRLQWALESGRQDSTEKAAEELVNSLTQVFQVPSVRLRVLEKRPSRNWGELHGLYEMRPRTSPPLITVWMRTAKRIQVVAFKTFLRTLLHEVMHHLDYTYLRLPDSFHTEGFYKRESSLLHQLLEKNL